MNRQDFTLILANLIIKADNLLVSKGMALRLIWVERKAADLILIGCRPDGMLDQLDPRKVCPNEWGTIRRYWIEMGGEEMISWDPCHFEVK
jgi:hypothetical protein